MSYSLFIEAKEADMIQSNHNPSALLPQVLAAVSQAGAMIRAEFHLPGGPRGSGSTAPIDREI